MFPLSKKPIRAVFFVGFIFAFHVALTTYINSSFATQFGLAPGILFAGGALLTIIGFFAMPRLLNRLGNRSIALSLAGSITLALFGLSRASHPALIAILLIIYLAANTLFFYSLDIFLEEHSDDTTTGTIRGSYLSTLNSAWLFAPIVAGAILATAKFKSIYALSMLLLVPVCTIVWSTFKNFKDPRYIEIPVLSTARKVFANSDIRKIYSTAFLLQFFFASMTIFMPIYLNQVIGFSWPVIGLIFTIMLLPFVLLERPLGYLADTRFGEKEILSIGFVIVALSTIAIALLDSTNPLVWAFVLFMTRVGAASIEVMNDSYFFKHVESSDAGIIGFFRSATPFAYIISPLLVTAGLALFSFQTVFISVGIILFSGLFFSLRIKDTK